MHKFERAILHVGPDKTGSTAIQKTLDKSREILAKNNICYAIGHRHHKLASYFDKEKISNFSFYKDYSSSDIIERDNSYIKLLHEQIKNSRENEIIYSFEGFIHLTVNQLEDMRSFLLDHSNKILVVVYAREPISYAKSAMSQRVKTGRTSWGKHLPYLKYKNLITKLVTVFGENNIEVRKFCKSSFPQGDVVLDFLSLFNIQQSDTNFIIEKSPERNISLSHNGLLVGERVIQLLNGRFKTGADFKKNIGHYLTKIDGPPITLDSKQIKAINNCSREHSKYLENKFGVIFSKNHSPFTPPLYNVEEKSQLIIEQILKNPQPHRENKNFESNNSYWYCKNRKQLYTRILITKQRDFISKWLPFFTMRRNK